MLRILVPTDFSKCARNALTYAMHLFKDEPAEFILMHAYEPSFIKMLGNRSPYNLEVTHSKLKSKALKKLGKMRDELLEENSNHQFSILASNGHLKEIIAGLSRTDYHYIVMGTKGATGIREIFMGSTTYGIVTTRQQIPLLIVPENAVFTKLDNIAFATDFQRHFAKTEFQPLTLLAKLWGSTVRSIEIYKEPEFSYKQERHVAQLEKLLSDVEYSFHTMEKFASLENCINSFDEELDIDMLVMIEYSKTFFEQLVTEPIIKKMTFHTTLPFLIIPESN